MNLVTSVAMRHLFIICSVLALCIAGLVAPPGEASRIQPGSEHRVYLPIASKSLSSPAADPTVRILSSRSYLKGKTRYIVGEVINETDSPVYYINIDAKFYDGANSLVAVEDGYTSLVETQPGQRSSFVIFLFNAPPTTTWFQLARSWRTSSVFDYHPVKVLSQQTRNNRGVEVFGVLRNDQKHQLRGIEVVVTFYDSAGKVVATDSSYVSAKTLAPGATSAYNIATFEDFKFASYTVQAEGYAAP